MDQDKKNFLIVLTLSTILIPLVLYLLVSHLFNVYMGVVGGLTLSNIIILFLICLYTVCFSTISFYIFVKENRKCSNFSCALRLLFYYRGRIHMVVVPYEACFLFFFMIFWFYLPMNLIYQIVLGFVLSIPVVSAVHIGIRKREKSIRDEWKRIDEKTDKILKEVEKTLQS